MKLTPRSYQKDAHDIAIDNFKKSIEPIVISAATGSGKSIIVAMLAESLNALSGGKRVLCLAPTAELTLQNHEKFLATGAKASIYSASISKSLKHQVIFATPLTFKKVAKRLGSEFTGVIVDECHKTTETIKTIISDLKEGNPNLRICGLSATPFRLGQGYIYGIDINNKALDESLAKAPFYKRCVYEISADYLVNQGFLTPLTVAGTADNYDTSNLIIKNNGQFDTESVKMAFEGHGRKTAGIVADIVSKTQETTGTMIFAATIAHAKEVMASLHPENSRLITGETKTTERTKIINDFKKRKFDYLVNVSVLTTGFDAPNVSHIAILRATESASLLIQVMGRGMRLFDGKSEAVILDYANNITKHMPSGDLYNAEIKAVGGGGDKSYINAKCEQCERINCFSARPNKDGYKIDGNGYFTDLLDKRIMVNGLPMPAHFGRRCQHTNLKTQERCSYTWSSKTCLVCETDNDIAARFCSGCKAELVNPNDKLIALHNQKRNDLKQWRTESLNSITYKHGVSSAGNKMITAELTTSHRVFNIYLTEHTDFSARLKQSFANATSDFKKVPTTVTYRKNGNFFEVSGFNAETDESILKSKLDAITE